MKLAGREIAVIGAGIGGLAAATALAQRGARVQVFEQAPVLAEVGAGLQIGPNAVAVLEALGMRSAAERLASLPQAIELRDYREGSLVARIPFGDGCVARYGRPYWHFHRADLLSVLVAGASEAGVELHPGTRISAVLPEDYGIRVCPESGPEIPADIVIAADGVRSAIRSAHFDGSPARFTGNAAWRGLVDASALPEGLFPDAATITMGPGRHVVAYPLRDGRLINFVAVEERDDWAAEGWTEADDPENLRKAFAGWGGAVEALLAQVSETFVWGLFDHAPLPVWSKNHIALLGDACHPMLPFLAQGAAMALEDAWVLAAELDVADTLDLGLFAYEGRRAARARRVQRASTQNGRIYHMGPGIRDAAHLGLRAASTLSPGLLLRKFDWLYGADVVSAEATG